MPQPKSAFTVKYDKIVRELKHDVLISEACLEPLDGQSVKTIKYNAIWDTGASRTAISVRVVNDLDLIFVNEIDIQTANGLRKAKTYLVNIYLPNHVVVPGLEVTDCDFKNCDVLVGMDIIGNGDFSVTQKNGRSVMTFQMPSTHSTDYVQEIETKKK